MASGRMWVSAIATALIVVGAAFAIYGLAMTSYTPWTVAWNNYTYSFWGGLVGIVVGAVAGLWAWLGMKPTFAPREEMARHIPA